MFNIPKNQLSQIYIDQSINIEKQLFYNIISDLNRYENILLDLNNHVEQLQILINVGGELLLGGAYSDSAFLKQILIFPICTPQ